jgi:hypothetical protein
MEVALGFIGFTDVRSILVEPTLGVDAEAMAQKRKAAASLAEAMEKSFATHFAKCVVKADARLLSGGMEA